MIIFSLTLLVFLFLVNYLAKKLEHVPVEKWKDVFIAYDNMCNLDRMKATKKDLPLPPPFNKMWSSVSKIIDSFHLKNHKGENCKLLYNPEKLKVVHENYNTQACEQTFSNTKWLFLRSRNCIAQGYFYGKMICACAVSSRRKSK